MRYDIYTFVKSHPAWVCGLKQYRNLAGDAYPASHPAWVCGLKHRFQTTCYGRNDVTPCVGVWIETLLQLQGLSQNNVTPCVGVWIETLSK